MVEVVVYNPKWPEMFEQESNSLKTVLGHNLIGIYHIGSTSVPGLAAKPKIDILAVVKDLHAVNQLGYKFRGEFNIPFHSCYTKRSADADVNLHIFEENNPEIELNLLFRDFLRGNAEACAEYAALKFQLLEDESSHQKNDSIFVGYTLGKNNFIQKILKQVRFDGLCIRFVTHYMEWEEYHRIRKEQIFDRMKVEYDPNHPCIKDPQNRHFVLYKGADIVGTAHTEFLSLSDAALRPFAIDFPYQSHGLGSKYLAMIEKWIKSQGRSYLRLNANPEAINFYQRLGYSVMEFKDHHKKINYEIIPMGKKL